MKKEVPMFEKGTKVKITKPVHGTSQQLVGRTGTITRVGKWLTVMLDDPFVESHVPYNGTIFPKANASAYLKVL
jgi:hypothetical protein